FRELDGTHPLRDAVPGACVDYRARRVHGGEVVWFNHALAREMGLVPRDHPDRLTSRVRREGLDAVALTIINEYHLAHRTRFPPSQVLPGRYMATRYLQLQHPGRRGRTSGDGRSVWNGILRGPSGTWDVTSCGTGVTRLCPATAWSNRFYKTGSRAADYCCG